MSAYSELMANAIAPLGLACSEEPMLNPPAGAAYITWRNLGEANVIASGRVYERRTEMSVKLLALPGGGWQPLADRLVERLKAAGLYGVRRAAEMWDEEKGRRVIIIGCYVRGE